MTGQPGFFDTEERLRWLSASGDPLEGLRTVVDFDAFRVELEAAHRYLTIPLAFCRTCSTRLTQPRPKAAKVLRLR